MTTSDTPQRQPLLNNASQRILTALVVIPLALIVTAVGGWLMFAVLLALIVIGLLEFYHMEQQRHQQGNALLGISCSVIVLLGAFFQRVDVVVLALLAGALLVLGVELLRRQRLPQAAFRVLTTLGGVVYLALPAGCLLLIRAIPENGLWWTYIVYLAAWGTDTMAYFIGRQFGRRPLAPALSPKKTLEGAMAGVVGGITFPLLLLLVTHLESPSALIVLVMAPFASIWGDLFESALKRYFGLKDSGLRGLNLFPGHGGVLDRLDSLLPVAVLFFVYLLLIGQIAL